MQADGLFFVQGGLFAALLLTAGLWDIRKRTIPDTLSLCIALTGFLNFKPFHLLGMAAALPLFLAALKWGGMGGGDIKLMASVGLVLGLPGGMAALVLGLSAMLVFHLFDYSFQRLRRRKVRGAYPFAPFLSAGCLVLYFIYCQGR